MKHRIMVRWQESIWDELHEQVLKTVAQGGSLSLEDPDQNGAYYPATILADLQPEWKVLIMNYLVQHLSFVQRMITKLLL
jgi:hypothetical protein